MTTSPWIARDACDREGCPMRQYQHRHRADGTPEPAVADPEMHDGVARATDSAAGGALAAHLTHCAEVMRDRGSFLTGTEQTIIHAALADAASVLRSRRTAAPASEAATEGDAWAGWYRRLGMLTEWGDLRATHRADPAVLLARLLAATPREPGTAEAATTSGEIARTLRSLHSTLVTQVRDMGAEHMEAWLYGVLVGWDCEPKCEDPTDTEHACDGAMRELAERFAWSPSGVAELRRLRRSVIAALAAAPREQGTAEAATVVRDVVDAAEVDRVVRASFGRRVAPTDEPIAWDAVRAVLDTVSARCAPPAPEVVSGAEAAALPEPDGQVGDCPIWTVHDASGDDEYGAEGETWTVQVGPHSEVSLDGAAVSAPERVALALLAAARYVDSVGDGPPPPLAVGDVVETAADLDRLPEGTGVRDGDGHLADRLTIALGDWIVYSPSPYNTRFGPPTLPVRVLDLPDAGAL